MELPQARFGGDDTDVIVSKADDRRIDQDEPCSGKRAVFGWHD